MRWGQNPKVFAATLLLLCWGMGAFAADGDTLRLRPVEKPKKKYPYQPLVIKTSPTAFLWGGIFPLTAEYRVMAELTSGRTQSDQASISFLGRNIFLGALDPYFRQLKVRGWKLTYAHKFYLISRRKHAPYGFYVAPMFTYADARASVGQTRLSMDAYYNFRQYTADLVIGVQVGKKGRLTLDVYGGAGYKNNKLFYNFAPGRVITLDTEEFGPFYNSNTHLAFGINLGWSM